MSYELWGMSYVKIITSLLTIFSLFCAKHSFSQGATQDFNYPTLATVTLHPKDLPTATPFVHLSGGVLTLRFDDLTADYNSYNVRVVHHTSDWWPSDIHPNEYIDGFYDIPISDMEDSFGTMVEYTHYRVDLPSDDMVWTKSGNYLLEVFDPSNPEEVLISRRFVVYEDLCSVESRMMEPMEIAHRRTHQEVVFTVTEGAYTFIDPYSNLVTAVLQNGRWDNALSGLQPRFIKGRELDFSQIGYVFPGGNSYRYADLKSLSFAARGVAGIAKGDLTFHHMLEPSERRTYTYHKVWPDLNGRRVISNDRHEINTGSDYTRAHFSIPMPYELVGRDIFIFGDLSNGQCLHTHRLQWNSANSSYEGNLLLKQGYYDFLYLVKDVLAKPEEPGITADLEGNHFATDNLYSVIVYYADFDGYDRVVGFNQWNSKQQ